MGKIKALSLFSGGLDSILASKIVKDMGIEVIGIYFETGFENRNKEEKKDYLKQIAQKIGIFLDIVDITEQFIADILFSPKYGYGKNLNPCIDCHANMIKIAKMLLPKYKAKFIITGEVVAQRPMSQRKEALKNIERLSESESIVLRPLSAKLLEPTYPEKAGWVNREKLFAISGRSRSVQIELAKKYNIDKYESPAGGCLLTDRNFSNKLKEFVKFEKLNSKEIEILKTGRHFRLKEKIRLVIGRNKTENEKLLKLKGDNYIFIKPLLKGPLGLLTKEASLNERTEAARVILAFCKTKRDEKYRVSLENEIVEVFPMTRAETRKFVL